MLMNFRRVFLLGVISQIMLIEQQGQLLGKVLERTVENRMGVVLHTNSEEPRSLQIRAGSSMGLKDKPAPLRKCTFLNHGPMVFRESLCGRIQANFPGCTKNCTKLQFEVWLIHHGDGLQLLLRLPSLSLPAALSCVVFFVCAMRCMFSSATCNFHEINKNAFALSKSVSKIVIPLHYLEEKML